MNFEIVIPLSIFFYIKDVKRVQMDQATDMSVEITAEVQEMRHKLRSKSDEVVGKFCI